MFSWLCTRADSRCLQLGYKFVVKLLESKGDVNLTTCRFSAYSVLAVLMLSKCIRSGH